ncbi:fibronectin type III domain-containing protein [Myroides sp. NP-2]|uniref:MBG domain-containing protein n=1 Tax=Myroides sp. NP-2 TaxID=2759945 RepID=UPI0015FA5807|nr:MBG domain-containing protein [Myroides sp. NP-2]MBB1150545.1 fibronectin type III domain-containing protein [Myroides sp. NP-2]
MKKAPLTFLLPLFLLWNVVLHAQTYQPLSLDGFNEDVIANGIGTAVSSTTNDIDGVSYCLRSLDWKLTAESQPMTSGLPTNGSITSQDSTTPNLLFQLQDYSSNNVIRLKTTVNTITSNVGGQVKSQNIYILATSTSGSSVLECKVIFEDDSFQVMSITLPDWYNGTNLSVAFQGFGRINRMNNMLENSTTNPRLYQFPIPITLENQTKAIKSIAFSHVEGQGISSVFGATAELVPSCPNPTSIIINQITSSTAKANITPPNIAPDRGYDFQVRSYGNPSDGNTGFVVSGSTIASNLTVELPFLTSGETFYFYVRSKCSTTEFGDWLGPFVFTTLCETRGAFIENFESQPVGTVNNASLPGCWGKISTGNGYLYTSSASAYSGNHSLYLYNSNQNTGDLLVVSPPTNHLGNGGYRVRFRARSTASALSTLNVVTLEDPNTTVGMQSLATIPLTTSFKEYFVNFPAGTANYFGLAHGLSSEYQAIYMDDIRFEPIPSCLVPTDLTVSAVGLNTATIAWTATSSPNTEGYTYEIRTSGEAGSGTTGLAFSAQVDSNTRTVNLANLVAGTTYHAYVKANCTATEESYWTDAATFTPNWCTPTYVNGSSNHRITVVNIDEINFTDQIPSYTQRDRTAESIPDLTVGNTYTFNVTTTGYTGMGVAIDFNNDGVFDQQTEVSALSDYIPNNTQVYTATVTIPNTIATGNYRMRIWNRIANAGGMDDGADPCGSYNYGTWADYTVKILEVTPPPVAVDQVFCKNENKKVSDLTATGENIKWYASETATTALLPSTLLSSGTYYATQTIGGQESVRRTPIQVEIEDPKLNSISVSSSFQYNTQTQVILVGIRSVLGPYVLTWYEEETGGVSIPTPDIAVLPVGTHVYWVSTFSTAGCESKRSKITLVVNPLTLYVIPTAITKYYGDADPELRYTIYGGYSEIPLTGSLARDPGENVGSYAIRQGTLTTSSNYSLIMTTATLTISPAPLTVTADAKTKEMGAADPMLIYQVSGLKNGELAEDVLTGTLTRDPGEETGVYPITQGTLALTSANYAMRYQPANLTIRTTTIVVQANDKTKVYGDTDPTLTYTVSGLDPAVDPSTVLMGSLSREPGENVSSYAITQGTLTAVAGYTLQFEAADLTITPATVTITAEAKTKVYGDTDPTLTYTVNGLKGTDTLTGSLVREVGETVGTYEIQQGSVAASTDYTLVYQAADLDITPATVTITAEAKTKVYGDTDPLLTYTVNGLKGTDTLTGSLVREGGETVGTYEIQQGSVAASTDYTLVYQAADLDITPATVTITAEAKTKVYGDIDPILTYTVRGLKGTDTLTGSLVREVGEAVGTYEIQQGSVAATTDYTVAYQAADLTITPATVTITAEAKTKVYGDTDPLLTYTVRGLKGTDTLTGSLVREVGEAVGTYEIQQGSLAASTDYTLVYQAADLTIFPIELVIYPQQNQEKEYGTDDPTLAFTVEGLRNGDTIATALRGALGRSTSENVGRYRYTLGSLESIANNYVLRLNTEERFEITPAPVAIVVEIGQYKHYGQADPVLRYEIQGLRRGDYPANTMTGQLKREPGEEVGQYTIVQGSLAPRSNYTIRSFTTASFEIKRGEIQGLILPSKTVVYDGEPQYLQVEGPLSLGAVVTYENNEQTQVGRYTVVATITDEPNYEPLRLVGTLTITPAEQHIRFGAVSTVVLEDTPSLPLQAVASSGLAVTYTIDDPAEQALAQVDAAGVIHFLQPGVVTVTAHQEGNANYKAAAPVSQTIEISSRDASIWNLLVDGVSHGKIEKVVELVLDCSTPQEEVVLEIITQVGAVVSPSNYITVPVTTYGIHEQVIVVQSANGQVTTTYTIRIDKRIPTERIVFQKYDKVLLVNNNKQTNGGYVFSGYEWFKNGMSLGKKQFYAEQGDAGTTLDVDAEYLVELTLHNGQKIRSCPIFIQGKTTENWAVYPNPVQKSAWLYVRLEEEARQEATTYKIYNITGQLIKSGALDKGKMGIEIPSTVAAGSYYLVLNRAGKQQGIQFIVQ